MTRVDLHVHSCHSRHPSEWFLQRLGAQESYTEVESVYARWRDEIRDASRSAHNWETVLDDLMGPRPAAHAATAPAVIASANRPDAFVAADACL